MKKAFVLACALFLAQIVCLARDYNVADTTIVDTVIVKDTITIKVADTAAYNADSATLYNDLAQQKLHPEVLYVKKSKSILPSLIITLIILAGAGLYLLLATGMCRDMSYYPHNNQLRPVKERPYSYSRLQLFWWTIITLGCYVAFYFYTGKLAAITPTIVLLLGGGLATSMFGNVIDNNQIQRNNSEGVPIRHQDTDPTQGLITDILSDENGISIHRFQALVLNLVFGFGYITAFARLVKLQQYPFLEFEPWQLTLLGVSAAGYLGFKANENPDATKTQRKIDAVKKTETGVSAPSDGTDEQGGGKSLAPRSAKTSVPYEALKSRLNSLGMLDTSTEEPVVKDINKF